MNQVNTFEKRKTTTFKWIFDFLNFEDCALVKGYIYYRLYIYYYICLYIIYYIFIVYILLLLYMHRLS